MLNDLFYDYVHEDVRFFFDLTEYRLFVIAVHTAQVQSRITTESLVDSLVLFLVQVPIFIVHIVLSACLQNVQSSKITSISRYSLELKRMRDFFEVRYIEKFTTHYHSSRDYI